MLRLAALGSRFVGQLRTRSLDDVDTVWLGADASRFLAEVPALAPDVVVIDLADLRVADDATLRKLVTATRAELTIVTYDFARRKYLRDLQGLGVRVLQSPVALETLRAHLAPLVIRRTLTNLVKKESTMATPDAPRFNRQQLGQLMEIASAIQCECPNHLAQIVEKLQAFEAYSKDCENRDDADREVHARLYASTAQARQEMERALEVLVAHEQISLAP